MVNCDNVISIQNITTSMRATQPLTHALGARPAVQPQSCREMRVKLRNHQNINTTNPTRKETRFPFHYHVTFRVCPTAKSSHRAEIVSRGYASTCTSSIRATCTIYSVVRCKHSLLSTPYSCTKTPLRSTCILN